jgi:NADH-quinone oxidoreductase subunit G
MIRDDWNGFNVLHRAAARVGGLDLGFLPGAGGRDVAGILDGCRKGDIEVLYLLGADELDLPIPVRPS